MASLHVARFAIGPTSFIVTFSCLNNCTFGIANNCEGNPQVLVDHGKCLAQCIMAYGSTPYVGMILKKSSASMANKTVNFAGKYC